MSADGAVDQARRSYGADVVPIADVHPYDQNPRRGNIDAIRESLQAHGQYRPLVVRTETKEVLVGNHTLYAARELEWDEISVIYVDVDEDEAKRIVLVDNRTADLAEYDDSDLTALLQSLPELDGSGFDQKDLDKLVAKLEPEDTSPQLSHTEYRLMIECSDERHQAELLERFAKEGLIVKAYVG